jgi:hypothetical protein
MCCAVARSAPNRQSDEDYVALEEKLFNILDEQEEKEQTQQLNELKLQAIDDAKRDAAAALQQQQLAAAARAAASSNPTIRLRSSVAAAAAAAGVDGADGKYGEEAKDGAAAEAAGGDFDRGRALSDVVDGGGINIMSENEEKEALLGGVSLVRRLASRSLV